MSLNANDLIMFARIVEAGSFSRASERTGLPRSTLSRRITALETLLGQRLLTRSTRRLAITEFGESMLKHAKRMLDETEAAAALALHQQETPQGTLRVSLPPEFHELELVSFLTRFAKTYPLVRLELDLSSRRVDLIAERFDVAIRIANQLPDDSTLVARKLTTLHNGLYASPSYLAEHGTPADPSDLYRHAGLVLITSNGEPQPWRLSRGHEHREGFPDSAVSANSLGLQRTLAVEGMGIVGLSVRYASPLVEQGLLQRILPDWQLPTMTVWCATPGRRLLPARSKAFIETFTAAIQNGHGI